MPTLCNRVVIFSLCLQKKNSGNFELVGVDLYRTINNHTNIVYNYEIWNVTEWADLSFRKTYFFLPGKLLEFKNLSKSFSIFESPLFLGQPECLSKVALK